MNLAHQDLFDLSAVFGMIVVIFLFLILFESRYPTKIYLASLIPFMILWVGGNLYLLFAYGANFLGRWLLLTCTLTYSCLFWLAIMLIPQVFVGIFTSDPELTETAVWAARIFLFGVFPLGPRWGSSRAFWPWGRPKPPCCWRCCGKSCCSSP